MSAIAARVAASKNPNRRRRSPSRTGSPPPIPDDSGRLSGKESIPSVEEAAAAAAKSDAAIRAEREESNIDITSPIRLSEQARTVIASLRRQRDEAEDWVKWKEVVWATKKIQDDLDAAAGDISNPKAKRQEIPHPRVNHGKNKQKAVQRQIFDDLETPLKPPEHIPEGFCHQCFVPLPDDPDPETLFIYLHARRYKTAHLGTWETPLPRWAGENWDGDWRGWDGEPPVSALPPPQRENVTSMDVKAAVALQDGDVKEEQVAAFG